MKKLLLLPLLISLKLFASSIIVSGGGSGGGGSITIEGLTGTTFDLATGTTGSDFNIAAAGGTITFHIPDAGASARGLVTTGTQTIAGAKTFSSDIVAGASLNVNGSLHVGTPTTLVPFSVDTAPVLTSGSYIGTYINNTHVASGNVSAGIIGNLNQTAAQMNGFSHSGTTSGVLGETRLTTSGSLNIAAGVRGTVTNSSTGTITDAMAFRASAVANTGGGTITNAYGLYLSNQTAGTNNYPIYSEGTKEAYFTAGASLAQGKFFVSNNGDLSKVNNVAYQWPSSQGASSTVLTNNGAGVLSWVASSATTPGGSNTQLQYNNSGSFGGAAGITYTSSTQSTTFTPTGAPTDAVSIDASALTGSNNYLKIGGTMGGAGTLKKGLYIDMVQPSSTGLGYGIHANISASGTTSGWTRGIYVSNTATNTSTTGDPINSTGGNTGYMTYLNSSTTTGATYGGAFQTNGGNYQNGLFINVAGSLGANAKSYGVRANVTNETGSGTAEAVGGYFKINTTTVPTSTLGFSSGLAADNGDTTSNIFTALDNGSSVFQIRDGGITVIGGHGSVASHTLNGTLNGGSVFPVRTAPYSVVGLPDQASIPLDATLGNTFKLTATGDRTILAPVGAVDGQRIIINHTASGGARTLTLTTGSAGAFIFGEDITGLTATTSGKTDVIGCIYDSVSARWRVVAVSKGY